jgi:hypothetical protein
MTSFLAQDEQLEMLPARTQLTTFSLGGNGGNGGNGGSSSVHNSWGSGHKWHCKG